MKNENFYSDEMDIDENKEDSKLNKSVKKKFSFEEKIENDCILTSKSVVHTIEKIKNIIIEMVHHSDEVIKTNFSDYLGEKLNHNYTYLANLFSEVQGTTIEKFLIAHKIERVKEL